MQILKEEMKIFQIIGLLCTEDWDTANILAMQIGEYQVSLYNFTEIKPYAIILTYNFVL